MLSPAAPASTNTTPELQLQKANDKIESLTKENANLKKRVAEAASRQVAPADQSYHNAAFHIIFVIIGWLIAKFVVWFPLDECSYISD